MVFIWLLHDQLWRNLKRGLWQLSEVVFDHTF